MASELAPLHLVRAFVALACLCGASVKNRVKSMSAKQLRAALEDVRTMIADDAVLGARISRVLNRSYGIAPLIPCPGEAHRNAHTDNCSQCAPRWGWIEQD